MSDLTLSELEVDPSSYVDPNGFLFRHAGALFRAIRPAREPFYRGLLADGALGALAEAHHLVPAEVTEHRIPEIDCNLVLRHPSVWPVTYCVEWCPSMLRRAALTTLELALAGLEHGALLQDAYPWNVLFEGTRPVFVDLTSLSPIETPLLWPAYQQFLNFFAHPLELGSLGKGRVARALLFDTIDGVRFEDLRAERPPSYPLRHPLRAATEAVSARLERRLQKSPALKEKLQQASRSARFADPTGGLRRDFLRRLLRRTERTRVRARPDSWRGYYAEVETDATSDLKAEQVQKLLEALRPASVLDLGCNVGRYATLAARAGAAVLAVDASEHCVETLYRKAEAEGLAITPIVADVLNPTPAFGFLARQFPSLVTRARSDLVLCLGLMHHMHINGRQPFERIAELLAELARRAVIFEYVDLDDGNIRRLDHGRPIEYTLETVSRALGRHFRLTVLDSDRPTRRLLLCEK